MTIRDVIFLVGIVLMAIAVAGPWWPEPARGYHTGLYSLGLLLAVAAHGWPAGLGAG